VEAPEVLKWIMRRLHSNVLAILIAASPAFGAAILVNGNCQVGNCASPDVVAVGSTSSTAFNLVITLANTDQYRIAGTVNFPNSATAIGVTVPFTIAYLGNASGTNSSSDSITIDFLQNDANTTTSGKFFETTEGGFSGPIAAGSSLQGQLTIGGRSLPVQGPFPSPSNFSATSGATPYTGLGNPLSFDLQRVIVFGAGSGVGATVYNGTTPGSSVGSSGDTATCEGGGSTLPIFNVPGVSPRTTAATSGCGVILCTSGSGSTLPIFRVGPKPDAAAASSSSCSVAMIDTTEGSCGTLPILVYDPTAPDSGGGSTLPILVFQAPPSDGTGSTLPILAIEGGGSTLPILVDSGGGATLPVLTVAAEGTGSTLPIVNSPADSTRATTPVSSTIPIEIATPFASVASSYTAAATCAAGTANCWITIPISGGNIAAASRTAITAIINPQTLQPGTYAANIAITVTPTGGQPFTVNQPIPFALAPAGPNLVLSQSGVQFVAASGSNAPPAQSIAVSNSGTGTLNFTATASTLSGNWLTASPTSGTAPAQVSIQANPTGLAPGTYSGLVQFTGTGAVNGSQAVEVTLTVSTAGPGPSISSNALVFVSTAGSVPPSQTVTLSTSSTQNQTAGTTISFSSGNGWFTATASAGTVTAAQPLAETIAVNPAGLKTGVYLGSMDVHITETNTDYPVEVLLVVRAASCTPTRLLPVITNLGAAFQATAGMPVPLTAQVFDDCGSPLTSGSVLAYFPGGDPDLSLTPLGQGQWSGTWLPHTITTAGPASVGILATSFASGVYGSSGLVGTLAANAAMPLVFAGGAVNSASYAVAPLAPGSRISIFGSNLASAPLSNNTSPYPPTLGGTQVLMGGEALPLQVVAPGLINAIVPYDLPLGVPQQLIVQQGAAYSMPETVVLAEAEPAVFTQNQSGQGPGVILVIKSDGTYFENSPTNPAHAGDLLVIYCTGLGAVAPPVTAGLAAPLATTSYVSNPVTVTIGGTSVPAAFAGLAPEFVTAYQVNVTVPPGIAPGINIPLTLTSAGATSVPVSIAIQ
jgi:uncharacterized protein (TIGR03437 family)